MPKEATSKKYFLFLFMWSVDADNGLFQRPIRSILSKNEPRGKLHRRLLLLLADVVCASDLQTEQKHNTKVPAWDSCMLKKSDNLC